MFQMMRPKRIIVMPRCILCGSTDNFQCGNCMLRVCWDCTPVYEDNECVHIKHTTVVSEGWPEYDP